MLRNTFNFTQDIMIIPLEEITLGNRKLIKDVYEVRQVFGDHTRTINRVEVAHRASRAVIREAVATALVRSQ